MLSPKTSQKPKYGQQDFLARIFRLREWGLEPDSEGLSLGFSTNSQTWFAPVIRRLWSSRTFTAFSLATEDETSPSYSRQWMNSGMAWHGECLTASISESPSRASECTLLPCIETQPVPEKYFLSQNAATGILRRVDQMGRNLPASFRRSLEILAKGRS